MGNNNIKTAEEIFRSELLATLFELWDTDYDRFPLPLCLDDREERQQLAGRERKIRNEVTAHIAALSGEAVQKDNWIRVEDRLPECDVQHGQDYESGMVLTWDGGEIEILSYWKMGKGINGWSSNAQVTHWKRLPSPPIKKALNL